jgi:hypothetical protein
VPPQCGDFWTPAGPVLGLVHRKSSTGGRGSATRPGLSHPTPVAFFGGLRFFRPLLATKLIAVVKAAAAFVATRGRCVLASKDSRDTACKKV